MEEKWTKFMQVLFIEKTLRYHHLEKLSALGKKYRDQKNDLMRSLVKLFANSLYGVEIRRYNKEKYKCKSETWMQTEYDENVLD